MKRITINDLSFISDIRDIKIALTRIIRAINEIDNISQTTDQSLESLSSLFTGHTHTLSEVVDAGALAYLNNITLSLVTDAGDLAALDEIDLSLVTDAGLLAKLDEIELTNIEDITSGNVIGRAIGAGTGVPTLIPINQSAGGVAAGDDSRFLTDLEKLFSTFIPVFNFMAINTGTTQITAGSGCTTYINKPRYQANQRVLTILHSLAFETGSTASGTNAVCRYNNMAGYGGFYLNDGLKIFIDFMNSTGISMNPIDKFRVGFFGNDTVPTVTGRPGTGVWLEYDKAIGSNILLCCANGSTVSTDDSGLALNTTRRRLMIHFVSSSLIDLYDIDSSLTTPIATLTTNIPSTEIPRTGTYFCQLTKDPAYHYGKILLNNFGVFHPVE